MRKSHKKDKKKTDRKHYYFGELMKGIRALRLSTFGKLNPCKNAPFEAPAIWGLSVVYYCTMRTHTSASLVFQGQIDKRKEMCRKNKIF